MGGLVPVGNKTRLTEKLKRNGMGVATLWILVILDNLVILDLMAGSILHHWQQLGLPTLLQAMQA